MTKKLILLLITLTTFVNVSYSSFPVTEKEPKEYIEESINIIKSPNSDYTWIYSLASFLLGILGWLFAIASVGGAMGGPDSVLNNLLAGLIISSIGAVVLGVLSVIKKSKGYVLGILGALLGILLLSLMIFSG